MNDPLTIAQLQVTLSLKVVLLINDLTKFTKYLSIGLIITCQHTSLHISVNFMLFFLRTSIFQNVLFS